MHVTWSILGCLLLTVITHSRPSFRTLQSFFNLAAMVECTVHSSNVDGALGFVGYGCYCGLGGGGDPVDAIDTCCQSHDECYGGLQEDQCLTMSVYLEGYEYEHDGCRSDSAKIECKSSDDYGGGPSARCKSSLCNCDRQLAECLAMQATSYNKMYEGWQFGEQCQQ
ncbi:basic phospholipase A2-like [Saccoglossus kowalevskii]